MCSRLLIDLTIDLQPLGSLLYPCLDPHNSYIDYHTSILDLNIMLKVIKALSSFTDIPNEWDSMYYYPLTGFVLFRPYNASIYYLGYHNNSILISLKVSNSI
jgi:hypothetical protein